MIKDKSNDNNYTFYNLNNILGLSFRGIYVLWLFVYGTEMDFRVKSCEIKILIKCSKQEFYKIDYKIILTRR